MFTKPLLLNAFDKPLTRNCVGGIVSGYSHVMLIDDMLICNVTGLRGDEGAMREKR